ncbi:hypothetical protein BX600DRAFT_224458 [Xylariales sp. PMI_506]|nr:hypothetical protein BX600DRAFT_224458 [Xylariales sp. PMI_506]
MTISLHSARGTPGVGPGSISAAASPFPFTTQLRKKCINLDECDRHRNDGNAVSSSTTLPDRAGRLAVHALLALLSCSIRIKVYLNLGNGVGQGNFAYLQAGKAVESAAQTNISLVCARGCCHHPGVRLSLFLPPWHNSPLPSSPTHTSMGGCLLVGTRVSHFIS